MIKSNEIFKASVTSNAGGITIQIPAEAKQHIEFSEDKVFVVVTNGVMQICEKEPRLAIPVFSSDLHTFSEVPR